jgi:hypothetical protein
MFKNRVQKIQVPVNPNSQIIQNLEKQHQQILTWHVIITIIISFCTMPKVRQNTQQLQHCTCLLVKCRKPLRTWHRLHRVYITFNSVITLEILTRHKRHHQTTQQSQSQSRVLSNNI